MFKNSGKKIMGYVNFVFYLFLVLVVLAIIGGSIYIYTQEGLDAAILVLLAGLVVGFVFMLLLFLSLLCLYAYGELVQSTIETRRMVAQIQLDTQRHASQPYREPCRPAPRGPVPVPPAAVPVAEPEPDPFDLPPRPNPPVNLAYDYKAAAGAPVNPVPNSGIQPGEVPGEAPGLVLCPKCGGKHDSLANHCRYCGTALK